MSKELEILKKKIGSRIRARREELRISQEDLAFRADVTATYLSQIEAGRRNPSLAVLYSICLALEMDLSGLVRL